jgi:hypothetical protein
MFREGSKYAKKNMNNLTNETAMDVKAITNFLESSMVPSEATFLGLHPRKGHHQRVSKKDQNFVETVVYNHHIESILRRCDHDGDAQLCY